MKRSGFYDCCIFVALFIIAISMVITLKLQIEINRHIAIATMAEIEAADSSTDSFSARNNVTLEINDTASIPETTDVQRVAETKAVRAAARSEARSAESTKKATVNTTVDTTVAVTEIDTVLVVNKNSKKIHSSTCSYAKNMKKENKAVISSDELQAYLDKGYTVCTRCKCYKR